MPETLYQDPAELHRSPEEYRIIPPWRERIKQPRWIIAIAGGTLALLLIIWIMTRPEPKPIVLGASDRSLAISPNGKLLAIGMRDGSLRLVGAESGHTLALAQLPASIQCVAFGPDDTVLALLQSQNLLYIFSNDLKSHSERLVQPHPRDVIWSQALGAAIVVSSGPDDIHPSLEFFPAQPLGIASSTSQVYGLQDWAAPVNVAVTADGSRVVVTLDTNRRANVIFYDPEKRRVAATALVSGKPRGIAIAADGNYVWVVGSTAENITEITAKVSAKSEFPKSASTSPLWMIGVNEGARRAYTTGALTFPEVDLAQNKITRTFELPTRSAAIALSPDRNTAYLTYQDANKIGVINLQDMKTYSEIDLPQSQ
jgi:DNA-binding beta-propeller fold protein YncE